jgi:putative phosphoesterase
MPAKGVEKIVDKRIAIISDIHGNLPALEAVLADLDAEGIEQIVCLGDVALFGPQPHEVIARLKDLDCPVVMGNTDAWALDPRPHEMRDENTQRVFDVEFWGTRQLSPADLDHVSTFQPIVEISLGEDTNLLCFHGSPRSNTDVIVSTTREDDLERMLSGFHATVMAGGHTHTQMLRRFGEVMLINPGSAGLPYDRVQLTGHVRHPPWAEYTVVGRQDGRLQVESRRTPFDVPALIQAALESGMPHWEWWIKDWSRE